MGLGVPQPYIAWARGETEDTTAMQAAIDEVKVDVSDQMTAATLKDGTAWIAALDGRNADAFSMAMEVPMEIFVIAPWIAFGSALWLQDEDRFEAAVARFADWPWPGAKEHRIKLYTEAGRTALAGSTPDAVAAFGALIEHLEEYGFPIELYGVRTLFAALVGQDVPEAREAAELAYQWIIDTGSYGYLELWKAGLPEQATEAAG